MADMVFFVVAAIACALAPNEYVLAGARFVMGLGVGIDLPVAMAFLSEFARLKGPGNKASSVAMWCPTGMRPSASLIFWCSSFTPCCRKATATGSGV